MRTFFRQSRQQKNLGFTIVELLVVIIVIGILAAISIVSYTGVQQGARDKSLLSDLDGVAGELTRYGTSNQGVYGPAVAWYSPSGTNVNIHFTPTSGNIIDVVANSTDYCIRGFNPSSKSYTTLATAAIKESTPGSCTSLPASAAALSVALACPSGFIVVPGSSTFGTNNFCVMKYDAKNVGGVATSQASGSPWVSISQSSALSTAAAACSGCHLITEAEWLTIANNLINVASNWSGGSVGSGYIYSGHNDSAPTGALAADTNDSNGYSGETNTGGNQRRTLTLNNGQVIWDFAGNVWQWTQGTIAGNQQAGLASDSSYGLKEWNNPSLLMGALSTTGLPSYGTPAASGWSSAQGIGELYSNYNSTNSTRAFQRGGSWGSGSWAGVFYLGTFQDSNTSTDTSTGFRVTK